VVASAPTPSGSLRIVDIGSILGDAPLRGLPILVLALSFIVIMLDGYDLICLSFVAPQLAKIFDIPVSSFGPVFTAGYVGIMVGGVLIGPLADRFGRKSVLIFSVALFGTFSLLPIVDLSYGHLIAYRFITGLGLGGAMPGAVALTTEYAPRRLRGLFVNLMFVGVACGGVVGGSLASRLVPAYGWTMVFWMGGLTPLLVTPVLAWLMPESVSFLSIKQRRPEYVVKILNRFVGVEMYSTADTTVVAESGKKVKGGFVAIFTEGRRARDPADLAHLVLGAANLRTVVVLASRLHDHARDDNADGHSGAGGPESRWHCRHCYPRPPVHPIRRVAADCWGSRLYGALARAPRTNNRNRQVCPLIGVRHRPVLARLGELDEHPDVGILPDEDPRHWRRLGSGRRPNWGSRGPCRRRHFALGALCALDDLPDRGHGCWCRAMRGSHGRRSLSRVSPAAAPRCRARSADVGFGTLGMISCP